MPSQTLSAAARIVATYMLWGLPAAAYAATDDAEGSGASKAGARRGHGPDAPLRQFPSHRFALRHLPDKPQLAFHFGLSQPILLGGFNAAVDIRYKRLFATYSHGHGLRFDGAAARRSDRDAGLSVSMPWTTGFGVGMILVDELWLSVDTKFHQFEVRYEGEARNYLTVTVGAELGWRFFLWRGLHIAPVIRYWPNVYSSSGRSIAFRDGDADVRHPTMSQGFNGLFANVLIGWAFGV